MIRFRSIQPAIPVALLVAFACGSPTGATDPGPGPSADRIVFIVNHVNGMNASEKAIEERVEALTGLPVVPITDEAYVAADTVGCRMVLFSKTADEEVVGDRLKGAPCGILFWEENAQVLQVMATVHSQGADGTFWHRAGSLVHVRPEAPAALRAGLEGAIELYVSLDSIPHVSYGRWDDMQGTDATVVAELERPGYHRAIYLYDRGDSLADGTPAAGRRLFFGLHRDTYRHLTAEGRALFDAAVEWTLGDD